MVDFVKLSIKAGNGGDGRISFLRTRYQPKGGPDGGDGGKGGSIIVQAHEHLHTLRDFAGRQKIEAENGKMGGKDKMHGADSEDIVLKLPVGTKIWSIISTHVRVQPKKMYRNDIELGRVERSIHRKTGHQVIQKNGVFTLPSAANEQTVEANGITRLKVREVEYEVRLVGEVVEHGQQLIVARGGRGGQGNWQFRGSQNTTPIEAETGEIGEQGDYIFELNVLADVGLVGYPNVGKSTLLSVLTNANPKIANYPFTTLEPNLGVLEQPSDDPNERRSVVIADIPGIIEGASVGKGLGHEFLRHIARCKVLVIVIAIDQEVLLQNGENVQFIKDELISQYETIEQELSAYSDSHSAELEVAGGVPMKDKKKFILLGKADLVEAEKREEILKEVKGILQDPLWVSGPGNIGIEELKKKLLS